MKFDCLRSIAHNVAASLASGCSVLVGAYEMDIFGEAARSPEGFIAVDFLTGAASGGTPSAALAAAIAKYREGLADLRLKHGVPAGAFKQLSARYAASPLGIRFVVTVTDQTGRTSIDEYEGEDGRRPKVLDGLGRVRPLKPASNC